MESMRNYKGKVREGIRNGKRNKEEDVRTYGKERGKNCKGEEREW